MLKLLHPINGRHMGRNLSGVVSTPNTFSQSHNRRLLNSDHRRHVRPHLPKLAPTRKKTIPSLTYGLKLLNAYTNMAKLLQRAPEMPVTPQIPAPPPRLETPTQIEQPQKNPSPQIPAQSPKVEINNQHKIRKIKEYHKTHLTQRASILQHCHQTRQTANQNQRSNYLQLTQAAVIQDHYQHHIDHLCNLAASPQHFTEGSGKQGKINKLVASPNDPTWTLSLAK